MTHTEYITIGDVDPTEQLNNLIAQNLIDSDCLVVLVYKNFSFSNSTESTSFKDIPLEEIKQIVETVHSYGAKINILFGGIKYPFLSPGQYETPVDLAIKVNGIVIECGFDGVMLETYEIRMGDDYGFSASIAEFINTLSEMNPIITISKNTFLF